jgi:hypothetical protein
MSVEGHAASSGSECDGVTINGQLLRGVVRPADAGVVPYQ